MISEQCSVNTWYAADKVIAEAISRFEYKKRPTFANIQVLFFGQFY